MDVFRTSLFISFCQSRTMHHHSKHAIGDTHAQVCEVRTGKPGSISSCSQLRHNAPTVHRVTLVTGSGLITSDISAHSILGGMHACIWDLRWPPSFTSSA